MWNRSTSLRASAVAMSAAALLFWAPIAGADDPPPCAPDDQQCQDQKQQQDAAEIAGQVGDNVEEGIDRVKPFIDPDTGKPNAGQAGLRVLINGVDTCLPVGVPAPLGADVRIVPGDMTGHCIVGP